MANKNRTFPAQYRLYENVEYKLVDKNGNVKPLWKMNAIGNFLMRKVREVVVSPIDSNGQVKPGLANHFSAYGFRVPFLMGGWVDALCVKNLVTNAGFAGVASRINGSGAEAAFTYIAVGTGTTAALVTDTTLETETAASGLSRASATVSRVTTTVTNDTAQLLLLFTVTGTVAVTESGVFNAGAAGTMLCRQVFSAINVVNTDNLQVTWKVKSA